MSESREGEGRRAPGGEGDVLGEGDALAGRRRLGEHDRPSAERLRGTGSADDGHVAEGEGAAEMDAEIARRDSDGGPGLRATEFDIARLPPD